jgi:hypothetical protein
VSPRTRLPLPRPMLGQWNDGIRYGRRMKASMIGQPYQVGFEQKALAGFPQTLSRSVVAKMGNRKLTARVTASHSSSAPQR